MQLMQLNSTRSPHKMRLPIRSGFCELFALGLFCHYRFILLSVRTGWNTDPLGERVSQQPFRQQRLQHGVSKRVFIRLWVPSVAYLELFEIMVSDPLWRSTN